MCGGISDKPLHLVQAFPSHVWWWNESWLSRWPGHWMLWIGGSRKISKVQKSINRLLTAHYFHGILSSTTWGSAKPTPKLQLFVDHSWSLSSAYSSWWFQSIVTNPVDWVTKSLVLWVPAEGAACTYQPQNIHDAWFLSSLKVAMIGGQISILFDPQWTLHCLLLAEFSLLSQKSREFSIQCNFLVDSIPVFVSFTVSIRLIWHFGPLHPRLCKFNLTCYGNHQVWRVVLAGKDSSGLWLCTREAKKK